MTRTTAARVHGAGQPEVFAMTFRRKLLICLVATALAPASTGGAAQAQERASGRMIELLDDALAQAQGAARAYQAAPETSQAAPAPTSQGAGDASAESYGYWAVSEAADGMKIGVVFPAYSPNEFVGAVLYCIENGGVRLTLDVAAPMPAGSSVDVAIVVGGATARYRGQAQDKATEDGGAVVVETSVTDPIFDDLAEGKTFAFVVNGDKAALPSRNSQSAFRRFLARCRR